MLDADISNLNNTTNGVSNSTINNKDKTVTVLLLLATVILTLMSITPWVNLSGHNILVLLPPLIIIFTLCSVAVIFLSSIFSYKKFKLSVIPLIILTLFNGDLILNSPNNNDKFNGANSLKIFTLNAEYGKANANQIMDVIRKHKSDIIVFVEMTKDKLNTLDGLGLKSIAPYRSANFDDGNGAQGSIIISKYPLANINVNASNNLYFQTPAALVSAPNGNVLVRAIHIFPPVGSNAKKWSGEMSSINDWYKDTRNKYDKIILAGDYNATYSYKNFRDSFGGTTDAYATVHYHRPTWPADKLFPFADLDHILTKGFYINKARIVKISGTDHEGLTTDLTY